jgi:hypothetical protein
MQDWLHSAANRLNCSSGIDGIVRVTIIIMTDFPSVTHDLFSSCILTPRDFGLLITFPNAKEDLSVPWEQSSRRALECGELFFLLRICSGDCEGGSWGSDDSVTTHFSSRALPP